MILVAAQVDDWKAFSECSGFDDTSRCASGSSLIWQLTCSVVQSGDVVLGIDAAK